MSNGWQTVKLGDVAVFLKGKGLSKDDITPNGSRECIHYGELFTKYSENIISIISRTDLKGSLVLSEANDVLMPTSDVTPRGLSTASYINKTGVILGGDVLVVRPERNKLNGLFLAYYVTANKRKVIRLVSGTTVFHLYGSDMGKLHVNLPPFSEQNRIVKILDTWDEYLEKLDKKIAAKKNVKNGLMQQLLTGKKRHPGFSDEWRSVTLGDVSNIKTGKKDNKDKVESGEYPFFVRSPIIERINTYSFDGEAILVPGEGNVGKIFHYINGKFDFHQRVYKISNFDKNTNGKFIYYLLSKDFANHTKRHSVKATVDSLRLPTFKMFEYLAPDRKEQDAIAEVLSVADEDIELLSKERDYIAEQRKFLLNNLISGKIRVPESITAKEAVHA